MRKLQGLRVEGKQKTEGVLRSVAILCILILGANLKS